ncbi:integrase, catalytic region, zinc finger, CCHC-type containing protein [Tanacetum coccineum]
MSTLAEFMIVAGANNRPPMLDKPQYESWKSRMELYIQGKDHGRIILNSVENEPLVWPTAEQEDGTVRLKTYKELSDKEKLQADCDLKATNIVLQGLPLDVYALVNHHQIAKDMGQSETLYQYYLRFAQLINDINIIQMTMQPVQVNTKFLNSLPPEWGKFVIDVKLARDLHTSNYDQVYAYLEQHEAHANEARLMRKRFTDPLALVANYHPQPSHFNNYHSQYTTPHYQQQLSPPIQHVHTQPSVPQHAYPPLTIPQPPQAEFPQIDSGLAVLTFLPGLRGNTSSQAKVVKCYNCQGEGHMARQCTQPKRRRDVAWFKESDDLDVYDSDCGDISSAKAILMANLSSCDLDVLSEAIVQNTNTSEQQNSMILSMFEQMSNHATNWDKANNESKIVNESLTAELERYKERVKILEHRFNVDLSGPQRIKPILYDGKVLSKTHDVLSVVDDEETLILAEESRSKMVEKQNDPIMKKEKINITPINYSELNKLAEDFRKRFVPQQELSAEQNCGYKVLTRTLKNLRTSNTLVKIEIPSELPKNDVYIELSKWFSNLEQHCISLEVAKQLNKENFQKDKLSDNQNHPKIQEYFEQNDLKAQLQTKDTVINKLKKKIHSLRENANPAKVKKDIDEIEIINIELEYIGGNADLKTQIHEKVFANAALKNELSNVKGKNVIDTTVLKPYATTIVPGMFKLNLEPLAPKS